MSPAIIAVVEGAFRPDGWRAEFYDLLDALNDMDATDMPSLKAQVRAAARKACAAASWEPPNGLVAQ